jgi:hypothetical protein
MGKYGVVKTPHWRFSVKSPPIGLRSKNGYSGRSALARSSRRSANPHEASVIFTLQSETPFERVVTQECRGVMLLCKSLYPLEMCDGVIRASDRETPTHRAQSNQTGGWRFARHRDNAYTTFTACCLTPQEATGD